MPNPKHQIRNKHQNPKLQVRFRGLLHSLPAAGIHEFIHESSFSRSGDLGEGSSCEAATANANTKGVIRSRVVSSPCRMIMIAPSGRNYVNVMSLNSGGIAFDASG